jgi:hypothetical protein
MTRALRLAPRGSQLRAAGEPRRRHPVGVRSCDHGLDLRIRCGRRRRPLPLRMPGKRVFAIDPVALETELPWPRACGAVPRRT